MTFRTRSLFEWSDWAVTTPTPKNKVITRIVEILRSIDSSWAKGARTQRRRTREAYKTGTTISGASKEVNLLAITLQRDLHHMVAEARLSDRPVG
jgi:hypothetical protein